MTPKFLIAGEAFPSKKAVAERVRRLLHENPLGTASGQDARFLKAFFRWHPNPEKRAHDLREVLIGRSEMGTRCFLLVRLDGTVCDASYKKPLQALTNLPVRKISAVAAMRAAVQDQVNEFRATPRTPRRHTTRSTSTSITSIRARSSGSSRCFSPSKA